MRVLLLLLAAVPAFAGPITFTFEGTWERTTSSAIVNVGDPYQGSFTFERFSGKAGDIAGELSFALDSLVFRQQWLSEWEEQGIGVIGAFAITDELACAGQRCTVFISFRERNRGDSIQIPFAHSGNITLDHDLFTVPEPATIVLVGSALMLLCRKFRAPRL